MEKTGILFLIMCIIFVITCIPRDKKTNIYEYIDRGCFTKIVETIKNNPEFSCIGETSKGYQVKLTTTFVSKIEYSNIECIPSGDFLEFKIYKDKELITHLKELSITEEKCLNQGFK